MTFIAPGRPAGSPTGIIRPLTVQRRTSALRLRGADEDGAREALGTDGIASASVLHGTSLEHLARIAFG